MKSILHSYAIYCVLIIFALLGLVGCATVETSRVIETPTESTTTYTGKQVPVAIGKFDNRSSFQRGIFSDGVDRLGGQARTILAAQLNLTNRFNVLDRENLDESGREQKFKQDTLQTKGADFLVTGSVTEFGRKEVGDRQLFGILGRGKQQIAYAKVTLNVINVVTSELVYTAQGAGEYALSNREIIGFGSTAKYDFTLNGKVLDLAMREAVEKLIPFANTQN